MGVSREEQAFAARALVEGLQADASVGFAVHDEELRFELISSSLAAINGLPAAEHIGKRVTDILPAPLGEAVEAVIAGVRDTGEPVAGLELDGTTAASEEVRSWVASYLPVQLGSRRLVGTVVVDITERRAMEAALHESRRVLSGAQAMAGMGWWAWNAEDDTITYTPELLARLGRDPALGDIPQSRDVLQAADRDEFRKVMRELRAAMTERRPFEYRLRARHADGTERILAARGQIVHGEGGAPIGIEGFAQDITELDRAISRQRAVAELGQAALAGTGLEELMGMAVQAVTASVMADGVGIAELPPSGAELQIRAATEDPQGEAALVPMTGRSLAVAALDSRQPVIVDDWRAETRFEITDRERAAGARSSINVAIAGRGRPFGILGAISRRPHAFGPDDAAFVQAVANVLADAVERRQGEAEVAELSAARGRLVAQALEAEERARRTISEALHDGPLQDLLAAGHDLFALTSRGGDDEALAHAQERLTSVIGQLREVMGALHPTVLQYGGIESALHSIAEQQGSAAGFEAQVSVDPAAAGLRDQLLTAVARELITNVAKHAGAGHVDVRLALEDGTVTLEVADDGAGLDPEQAAAALREGHIGLASCRERMEAVGGELTLSGTPGRGTRAIARAPASLDERPDRTARVPGLVDDSDRA